MNVLSDTEVSRLILTACTTHIQWLIDHVRIEDNQLIIDGWAVASEGFSQQARFLINEQEFEQVEYPIPSPDLGNLFWNTSTANNARFICKTPVNASTFADGFARFMFLPEGEVTLASLQRAWYFPDPRHAANLPDNKRIWRVIGVEDPDSYLMGGAAIFKRLEHYLIQNYIKNYADFPKILDWGCGCGRLTRHLQTVTNTKVTGLDVDPDNIAWCQEHLKQASFEQIPLLPPTHIPDKFFDLVIGISVLTHLNEEHQFLWLKELKRITKKGALLMISVHGLPQLGLYRSSPETFRQVEEKGFLVTGRNIALDGVISDNDYYIDVIHSRTYLQENWGKWFAVLDIVDAIAANQDLVVMRNED